MNQLLKNIEKTKWWFGEAPGVFQFCYAFMIGFIKLKKYFEINYNPGLLVIKNDYIWQCLSQKKTYRLGKYLHQQFSQNPRFLEKKIKIWKKFKTDFLAQGENIATTDLKKISRQELWNLYNNFQKSYINEFTIPLCTDGFGIYSDPFLASRLEKIDPKKRTEIQEAISLLSQPIKKPFLVREKIDFLKLYLARSQKNFSQRLKEHSDKYFWIRNNYQRAIYLSEDHFLALVKEEIDKHSQKEIRNELQKIERNWHNLKKKKKIIRNKIKLEKELDSLARLTGVLGWWQDQRKEMALRAAYYLDLLLKEIARRAKYSLEEVEYFLPQEIKDFLLRNKLPDKEILRKRSKLSIFVVRPDKEMMVTRERARKIYTILEKQRKFVSKILKGIVASQGKYGKKIRGRIKVILDPTTKDLRKGEILVTSMTRPEFTPLMKKAKALITNEGGLLSHAAIVSRELNLPCLIGTRQATEVLKDGDLVEVDAEKGIVKKIK